MLGKTSLLYVKIARATTPAYNSAAMQNDATPNPVLRLAVDCLTMAELRIAVDFLDNRLVGLLAQRQTYIERAALLKQDRAAVRDEARIEEVITKVLAAAKIAG